MKLHYYNAINRILYNTLLLKQKLLKNVPQIIAVTTFNVTYKVLIIKEKLTY